MRSKNILSIAAFIIAFSGSVVLASLFVTKTVQTIPTFSDYSRSTSCWKSRSNSRQSATAKKITAFINEDEANGYERDRKLSRVGKNFRPAFEGSTYSDYAVTIEEYVDDMNDLDASRLPGDFQTAWREHLKAWQDYSEFLEEMKSSSVRRSFELEELLHTDNLHSVEINQTWNNVLEIGRSHGANVY